MERADSQKKEESSNKRSPFELILNQLRRKKSVVERRQRVSVSRFFKSSDNNDKAAKNEVVTKESERNDADKEGNEEDEMSSVDGELCSVAGWGRVKHFLQKLGKKADRQHLTLGSCGLTATDLLELASLLAFLPELQELDLSWNDFIGGALKALTVHLQHVSHLKNLKLSNCRLTAEDVTALGEALGFIPHLEELELSWNSYLGGNLSCFTHYFQPGCKITALHLVDLGLTAADAKALGESLKVLPNLELLDLSVNKHFADGLCDFAPQLNHTTRLKVLKMHLCGLRQDSIHILGEVFNFLTCLETLDLSCNKELAGSFKDGASHLASLKKLQSLDLHLCCLNQEDMEALTQVIPLLSELEILDLSANKNIGGCAEQMFSRLRFLPKLKRVLLNSCGISEDAYHSLAEAISQLPQLECLHLSWNKCIGGNLHVLLNVLPSTSFLHVLQLSSCNLTGKDMTNLVSLMNLVNLKQLDLTYNDTVEDEGWDHFFKNANTLKDLTELDISLRPSTRRDCTPWFSSLKTFLTGTSALRELGLHRWLLSGLQSASLETISKSHNIKVHFDFSEPAQKEQHVSVDVA
ncbi:leucine-rich repeat-containing protein 31 [Polypterus senegalus]|uniref:leucine-rich repeat-containing protein 31 n=1 Tax=Polypterus senegalus TaxID=55291 RepID=UPI0019629381|nr:leucine-rich repeat-containing protein 31 [Polypterus senegalus]